jgi:hypothetical protein
MSLPLALVLAVQAAATGAPAAGAQKATPMTVQVQANAKGGETAKAWAAELRKLVEARKDEFRAPKPGEPPELVVRVDSVGPMAGGLTLMKGALVVRGATHPFDLRYQGPSAPQTEKLARNLRALAAQVKSNSKSK